MNIVVFGATGRIGTAIVDELIKRGHVVVGVSRTGLHDGGPAEVRYVAGDATDARQVADLAAGQDVIVGAVGARHDSNDDKRLVVNVAHALVAGAREAHVNRLVVIGGAGSLLTEDGTRLMDRQGFPPQLLPVAEAHSDALDVYRAVDDLNWTCISPPVTIEPGEQTGNYRQSIDVLVRDAEGTSRISIADFALALVNEIERNSAPRQRVTVAY